MATTIVSPTAREKPRSSAATTPEMAAGITTRRLVVRFRAPRPYAASRSERGTACIASSETDAIRGVIRMPTAIPAAAMVKSGVWPEQSGSTIVGLMTVSAKKPRTTLGIPASVSRIGFSVRRARLEAYSPR
jgi:hypothetical protein